MDASAPSSVFSASGSCFFLGLMGWHFVLQVLRVSSLSCPGWGWHCMGIGWFGKRGGAPRIRRGRLAWRLIGLAVHTAPSLGRKRFLFPCSFHFSPVLVLAAWVGVVVCCSPLVFGAPLCFSPWAVMLGRGQGSRSIPPTDAAVDRYG